MVLEFGGSVHPSCSSDSPRLCSLAPWFYECCAVDFSGSYVKRFPLYRVQVCWRVPWHPFKAHPYQQSILWRLSIRTLDEFTLVRIQRPSLAAAKLRVGGDAAHREARPFGKDARSCSYSPGCRFWTNSRSGGTPGLATRLLSRLHSSKRITITHMTVSCRGPNKWHNREA